MAAQPHDTIDAFGDPLAFRVRQGTARPSVIRNAAGQDVFKVEARQMAHHQKEAVVTEGSEGSAWRITSDEGRHLSGTDLAPFPLGVFNAGLHGDLYNRLLTTATASGVAVDDLRIHLDNRYSLTGSFVRGDAVGQAEPTRVTVKVKSAADASTLRAWVDRAVAASPAMAALRTPLENTFAIYVNGRRRPVSALPASPAADAPDPYLVHAKPPRPVAGPDPLQPLILRTGVQRAGVSQPAQASPTGRVLRLIVGNSHLLDGAGATETDTYLELPGASHFALRTDERPGTGAAGDQGPCGLSLLSAGIVFCYMTQLSRYIENMKLDIRGVRIVQYTPFALDGSLTAGTLAGRALPVDTHLFLNGGAADEVFERLQKIAAVTCYLHATLAAPLPPEVTIERDGQPL
jgi:uncharacterized OsmC-like protein